MWSVATVKPEGNWSRRCRPVERSTNSCMWNRSGRQAVWRFASNRPPQRSRDRAMRTCKRPMYRALAKRDPSFPACRSVGLCRTELSTVTTNSGGRSGECTHSTNFKTSAPLRFKDIILVLQAGSTIAAVDSTKLGDNIAPLWVRDTSDRTLDSVKRSLVGQPVVLPALLHVNGVPPRRGVQREPVRPAIHAARPGQQPLCMLSNACTISWRSTRKPARRCGYGLIFRRRA